MTNETKILTGIGLVTAVIIIGAAFTLGGKPTQTDKPKLIAKAQTKTLIRKDSHATGPATAKVTIVEFGDFQCPACGAAYPTVKQIEKDYQGKINLIFRNFPLPAAHPNAPMAALAAEAAGAQNKYWDMFDKLYSNQKDWSDEKNPLDIFTGYAKDLGLNTDQFKKDVQSKKYQTRIDQDQNDGNALGVNATPTFFINNEMNVGVLPYDQFKTKIDTILNKK